VPWPLMTASDQLELWFWELKDELTGKWRKTRYRMTEEDARTRHGENARKIEGTLEVRSSGAGAGFLLNIHGRMPRN
jgi:hypothetical protein